MTYLGSINFVFENKAHELWLVTKEGSVYLTMSHILYCFHIYTSLPTTQKYLRLHIKCPLCLSAFKIFVFSRQIFKNIFQHQISRKSVQWERTEGRT